MVPFLPLAPQPHPPCFAGAGACEAPQQPRPGPRPRCPGPSRLRGAPRSAATRGSWAAGEPRPLPAPPAEPNPGAAPRLFPVLPSASDFCLSACERSFIGLFDVAETRTVQTFIKTLPCGPWDYEY